MRAFLKQAILAAVAFTVIAQPAQAQFSDSYNFLKAVRERKGTEVEAALSSPGTVIVNTRDSYRCPTPR
jgi:uncharacterized protein